MNFNIRNTLVVFALGFLLQSITLAQILPVDYEKLKDIATTDELQKIYDQTTRPYDLRYLIQSTRWFFQTKNITTMPSWLIDKLALAAADEDPELSYEAIMAIDQLQINQIPDKLVKVYRESRSHDPAISGEIRMIIAHILQKDTSANCKIALSWLMKYPPDYIEDIIPAIDAMSKVGDAATLSDIKIFNANLRQRLALLNSNASSEPYEAKAIRKVLKHIEKTSMEIHSKDD